MTWKCKKKNSKKRILDFTIEEPVSFNQNGSDSYCIYDLTFYLHFIMRTNSVF